MMIDSYFKINPNVLIQMSNRKNLNPNWFALRDVNFLRKLRI